jgi:2-dehydro-3-deoxygluconokinase
LPPLGGFRIVHATGITAALGPRPLAAVEAASHAPAFTLDVNFRPALWSAPRCREALLPVAARAELVFVSEEDAVAVAPGDALAAGAKAVVRTLGPAGAEYLGADGTRAEAAPPHVEAVDTVGAGDAFVAGYLDAWLRGSGPAEALAAGCRLGAEAVSRVGDS